MVDLRAMPFFLDDNGAEWVEKTIGAMSAKEKIGQLFCPIGFTDNKAMLGHMVAEKHIGGMLFREMQGEKIQDIHRFLQAEANIPLILCANVETGGNGIASDGTAYGEQLQIAATADTHCAYTLGKIAGLEGAAVGLNMALGPIADIDMNYLNPITNVRTYGSDPQLVLDMSVACHRGLRDGGLAATAKHFPGDGVDDRDQHLLTSINRLSRKEWDERFGRIYSAMIGDGLLSIMAGHIALPAYQTEIDPAVSDVPLPASLSKDLLQGLLRKKLGFNGMVITDATPMVGFCAAMERSRAVPYCIEAGCDMLLFNKDLDEDFEYMLAGYHSGILSPERLEDAVRRILGTKAALGLHKKQAAGTLVPPANALSLLACEDHLAKAKDCAERSVTLVKDTTKLLPLSANRYRRVLLEVLGGCPSNERVEKKLVQLLEGKGFTVTCYRPEGFETLNNSVEAFKRSYDLVLYVANVETLSNQTVSRINWNTLFGMGNNIPWFVCEVPTVFVSVGNPYHLLDAPMVSCYINAYFNSDIMLECVVNKLMGASAFTGKSPIDPLCGRPELARSPVRRKSASFSAVIFDLDGVICSTDNYHFTAWKVIADRLNIPFDEIKNNRLRGVSRMESLDIILEDRFEPLSLSEREALAAEKNEIYCQLLNCMTPGDTHEGVMRVLHTLRSAGVGMAIGSSSKNARLILDKLGLTDEFDVITDGNDIARSKPDPEVFLLAAQRLNVHPTACLVIEDAKAGIQAAHAGGFKAAGIGDAAEDQSADFHLRSMEQILEII